MTAPTGTERLFAIGELLDSIIAALTPESHDSPAPAPAPINGNDGRVTS